jgi:hypothetical protein
MADLDGKLNLHRKCGRTFNSRTKFSVQFVWDLSTTFRDLNAVTVQLKTGKCLKIKEWLSGFQMPGDSVDGL